MATISASTQAPLIKDFIRGGDYQLQIPVTNSTGGAFDLTGCTIFFTMNLSPTPAVDATDSTAALKASTSSFATPLTGIALLAVPSASTALLSENTYYYDVKLKDATGKMTPLGRNKILVIDGISTRTS